MPPGTGSWLSGALGTLIAVGKGVIEGSSTLLTVVCEGWHPPVLKYATGSVGWKGSVLQMPAAWVPTALAKPSSCWGECYEMASFIFLASVL